MQTKTLILLKSGLPNAFGKFSRSKASQSRLIMEKNQTNFSTWSYQYNCLWSQWVSLNLSVKITTHKCEGNQIRTKNGIYGTQNNQQPYESTATFASRVSKTNKGCIKLQIQLKSHTLNQTDTRHTRKSLEKHIAFSK